MDLTRLLSLKTRATFFLLVGALCLFSIGSWWSVSSIIRSEIRGRLESHADRLAASLRSRLESQGARLIHLRAHFREESPAAEEFRRYLSGLGASSLVQGPSLVGYASVEGDARGAELLLAEPAVWQGRRFQGVRFPLPEYFFAPNAAHPWISEPVILAPIPSFSVARGDRKAMGMFLRVPSRGPTRGAFLSAFLFDDLFNDILGSPSLQREQVNFTLSDWQGSPLYDRFDFANLNPDSDLRTVREITIYGRTLELKIAPLPHFFSFVDRYLAMMVGLGAAMLSCLIILVLRVSQNQLDFEVLAKESSMEAARQGKLQIENLRRLNRFDQSLVGELDIDVLLHKFGTTLGNLTPVDAFLLFFSRGEGSLSLVHQQGLGDADLKRQTVPGSWLERLFAQTPQLRKGAAGAEEVLGSLLVDSSVFSDWLLASVSTRESGRCGLVFIARRNGRLISDVDRELFESMVSQFSTCVEIAQLFSRVEDASKAKNAFLANMSHEIRTPLSAIIGFSDILARDRIPAQEKRAVVENIRKNGEQLTCIIDDILDLSKVEAGKLKIERRRVRLGSVLNEIRCIMEPRARDKGISFSLSAAGPVPSHFETDEVRLKQILMNLAGNAIKFTERGKVDLVVRHLTPVSGENYLAFTIKDTGIGISEEAQAELFLPFSQGDASNTRRYGGSGLGLALSKRLAQQLGGDIALLESGRGQGSTFELRVKAGDLSFSSWSEDLFPPSLAPREAKAPHIDQALRGLKILVVEDSEDNQEIFKYFLESSGASTEVVANGFQAVKSAVTGKFDMILMDIQIPGIDGKEATRRIRQQGFANPIVALTAHAMAEEQESCMRAGCNGQITKPISGDLLVSRVAEYVGRC